MSTGTLWSADTFADDMIVNSESDLVGKQSGMMSRGEEHDKLSRLRFAKRALRVLFISAVLAQNLPEVCPHLLQILNLMCRLRKKPREVWSNLSAVL